MALAAITVICTAAALGTMLAAKLTLESPRTRLPSPLPQVLAGAVAIVAFLGGWLIVDLWWAASRSRRFVQRLAN